MAVNVEIQQAQTLIRRATARLEASDIIHILRSWALDQDGFMGLDEILVEIECGQVARATIVGTKRTEDPS